MSLQEKNAQYVDRILEPLLKVLTWSNISTGATEKYGN